MMNKLKLKDLYDQFRNPKTVKSLAALIEKESIKFKTPLRIM